MTAPAAPPAVRFAVSLAVVLALVAGCEGGTLKVTKLGAAAQRPSNVALYLSVADKFGQPVGGLATANFRVYEDKKLVSETRGKRALLPTGIASTRSALLLLDLSGPIVDAEDLPELAASAGRFVEKVGATQSVAVGAFDGGDEITALVGFGPADPAKVVAAIRKFRPRDRKSNLNGAVFQALASLRDQLAKATTTEKGGELVVFTDRGDLAHSVNPQVLDDALKSTPVDVYVIGVGAAVNRAELGAIGHNGIFISNDPKAFARGFDQVGAKLATASDGRYVFSYCTPKRRGEHDLRLEVTVPGDTGRVAYHFSADGFKPGCTPTRRPTLSGLPARAAQ